MVYCVALFDELLSLLVCLAYGPLLLYYYFPSRFVVMQARIRAAAEKVLVNKGYKVSSVHFRKPVEGESESLDADEKLLLYRDWFVEVEENKQDTSKRVMKVELKKDEVQTVGDLSGVLEERL
jgi:hypothetical protein